MTERIPVQSARDQRFIHEKGEVEHLRRKLEQVLDGANLQIHHFCAVVGCGHEVARFRTVCPWCVAAGRLPERRDRRKNPQHTDREDRADEDWSWNGTKGRSDPGR